MKTVSLETARKLKEAGYPIIHNVVTFSYCSECKKEIHPVDTGYPISGSDYRCPDCGSSYADMESNKKGIETKERQGNIILPCCCEILEQLPVNILISEGDSSYFCDLKIIKTEEEYIVCYYNELDYAPDYDHDKSTFKNISLTEACASCYIWCREEGYIK